MTKAELETELTELRSANASLRDQVVSWDSFRTAFGGHPRAVISRWVVKADEVNETLKEAARRIVLSGDFGDTNAMTNNDNARQLIILGILLEAVSECKEESLNAILVRLDIQP